MKIIGFDDIVNLNISPELCYQWVSEMLMCKKSAILPAKISMKPVGMYGVFLNCMPCVIPDFDCAGVKLVTRYPEREPSLDGQILLYRLGSGENIALMDGNWITTMRTGAVAAHSIIQFAVKDFKNIGMIGLGNTARATLKVLMSVCKNREFNVRLLKYKNQHELFVEVFKEYKNLNFIFCDAVEEVVESSEVIVSAVTVFQQDICEDKYFQEGCLLVPIHTRGFTNCDLFFDKVFADDVNHVKGFKNFDKFRSFAEVSQVLSGEKVGRQNSQERILVYNIGISLHDIYFANRIEAMCKEEKCVSLSAPKAKFWLE